VNKFTLKVKSTSSTKTKTKIFKGKKIEISIISLSIPPHSVKNLIRKKKATTNAGKNLILPKMSTYTNVAGSNIKKILNLKENFPNLLVEKIEEIYKTVKNSGKSKLKICIMTKGLLYHQIIILMNSETVSKVLVKSSKHVANINSLLKNINSNTIVDFIRVDSKDITITTNNVTAQSNLLTIEKYIKEINSIQSEDILTICLPQSKSYLKILGILYINKTNGTSIKLGDMENIIKTTYVFNNITLASKPHIIKISSKSDIAVV